MVKAFRYVVDFLISLPYQELSKSKAQDIVSLFPLAHPGLEFTSKLPENSQLLQYLDMRLVSALEQTCWYYSTQGEKGPFDSLHTKPVKQGIALSCMRQALYKSCSVGESVNLQMARLRRSGYPKGLLVSAAESYMKILTPQRTAQTTADQRRSFAVLRYIHGISCRFKKIATRFDVKVVLSAPNKVMSLFRMVKIRSKPKERCAV